MAQSNITIRQAKPEDTALILKFICMLAEYEKMLDDVQATEELLLEWVFEKQKAEVLIGEIDGEPMGFALYFHNFSTFVGRAGIYLEDLFVLPEARGKGLGKKLLLTLAKLAVERGCGRLEWACLNWNEPSIGFYKSLGAVPMEEWTTYRVAGKTLTDLADEAD